MTTRLSKINFQQGSDGTTLPQPVGDLHVVWKPDAQRWDFDPHYREQVTDFIRSMVPGGSLSDAQVLEDDAGTLALRTTSFLDQDGQWNRDAAGRTVARPVFVKITNGSVLP